MNHLHKLGNHILHVESILSVTVRKRWFCIFDKELPYEISVTYDKPCQQSQIFWMVGKGFHIGWMPTFHPTTDIDYRMTLERATEAQKAIEKKMAFLRMKQEEMEKEFTYLIDQEYDYKPTKHNDN